MIARPRPPTAETRALPGDIHIRPGSPSQGSVPGQHPLQILRIIAFIAHREGCRVSKLPRQEILLISTCAVDFIYIILNK